ncbi:sugar ABC transporter permease [Pelomonas sp. CA6]|uniref:carbohydrate ABC transporter permease n=1 Tax=Pelomonas sp. CA6 TaxID=2907999 RepID=UPI001F4AB58C|nr:sugar ABC transporter permease [Pelomonas sp. CA6]MCH7342952.1 sugar ABC transporter permease [Pelomonas sp. CA6]
MAAAPRPLARRLRRLTPWGALMPMAATVLLAYLGSALWTLRISLSSSRSFPKDDFVGLAQYERLFGNERWLQSLEHLALYGLVFIAATLVLGTLLAIAIDQRVRSESLWRGAFLYPYALSFVATGLIWQWLLTPGNGGFELDWLQNEDKVLYAVALAGVWQASGLVMALVLAGLRGVDEEVWKAAALDGIPRWRCYASIVLPQLGATYATVLLLLFTAAVKVFDAVVAMTQGGPGTASDVPARFIMDHLFGRANIALASAGAIVLLLGVLAVAAPLLYWRSRRAAAGGQA